MASPVPCGSWVRAALLLSLLGACSPVGTAIGIGATAVNMAAEERGFGTAVEDKAIWVDLNSRYLGRNGRLFERVNLQVHEGRVLISGFVPDLKDRQQAEAIAWATPGVREVSNEVKVGAALRPDDLAQDAFLAQRLRLKLLGDSRVRSRNYSVDCIRSTFYIIGIAADAGERQRVIDHARDVPYARAVVSRIRLVGDPLPPVRVPFPPPAAKTGQAGKG